MNRYLGYQKDDRNEKDFLFRALIEYGNVNIVVPEEVDYRSDVPDILDQGQLGSCVAQGGFGAVRLKHVFDGIKDPKLGNRLHAYWGIRAYAGNTDWDSGGQIRNMFRYLNEYGFMPEEDTEDGHDVKLFKEMPSKVDRQKMHDQKNKQEGQVRYYRISETGEDRVEAMKIAMANKGVIEMGVGVTQRFMDFDGNGAIPAPLEGEKILGGHAFYLAGYNSYGVWKVGSWGRGWGEQGIGLLSWDYVRNERAPDIWVVDKAPYYSGTS